MTQRSSFELYSYALRNEPWRSMPLEHVVSQFWLPLLHGPGQELYGPQGPYFVVREADTDQDDQVSLTVDLKFESNCDGISGYGVLIRMTRKTQGDGTVQIESSFELSDDDWEMMSDHPWHHDDPDFDHPDEWRRDLFSFCYDSAVAESMYAKSPAFVALADAFFSKSVDDADEEQIAVVETDEEQIAKVFKYVEMEVKRAFDRVAFKNIKDSIGEARHFTELRLKHVSGDTAVPGQSEVLEVDYILTVDEGALPSPDSSQIVVRVNLSRVIEDLEITWEQPAPRLHQYQVVTQKGRPLHYQVADFFAPDSDSKWAGVTVEDEDALIARVSEDYQNKICLAFSEHLGWTAKKSIHPPHRGSSNQDTLWFLFEAPKSLMSYDDQLLEFSGQISLSNDQGINEVLGAVPINCICVSDVTWGQYQSYDNGDYDSGSVQSYRHWSGDWSSYDGSVDAARNVFKDEPGVLERRYDPESGSGRVPVSPVAAIEKGFFGSDEWDGPEDPADLATMRDICNGISLESLDGGPQWQSGWLGHKFEGFRTGLIHIKWLSGEAFEDAWTQYQNRPIPRAITDCPADLSESDLLPEDENDMQSMVPSLIAAFASANGLAPIDPRLIEGQDTLYALMGYDDTMTQAVSANLLLHVDILASYPSHVLITVDCAVRVLTLIRRSCISAQY